jgi:hypothetical protein
MAQKRHLPDCPKGMHVVSTHSGYGCEKDGSNSNSGSSSGGGSSSEQRAWSDYENAQRQWDNDNSGRVAEQESADSAGRCTDFGNLPSCTDAKRRQAHHQSNAQDAASRMNADNQACHAAINAIKAARGQETAAGTKWFRSNPTPTSCKGDGQKINPLKH